MRSYSANPMDRPLELRGTPPEAPPQYQPEAEDPFEAEMYAAMQAHDSETRPRLEAAREAAAMKMIAERNVTDD